MHSIADLKSIGVAIKLPGHDADTYAERRRWRSKKAPSSPEIRLETAVLLGQWDEVIALIESGVDVSHCDNWILRMVTLAGDQAMIRFLVERGADPMAMHPYQVRKAEQLAQRALTAAGARSQFMTDPAGSSRGAASAAPHRFSLAAPALWVRKAAESVLSRSALVSFVS